MPILKLRFVSDFTDAIHIQTIASIIYIYLATITKAITFGGFLEDATESMQVCNLYLHVHSGLSISKKQLF